MTTYVALLRAVNVAGKNRIAMARLREAFVRAGHDDVATHIQSGNVILRSRLGAAAMTKRVESIVADEFGLSITAIVRTAAQLASVCAANPFVPDVVDTSSLYVAYLAAAPDRASTERFSAIVARTADDVEIVGNHAYIRYANGAGTTKLTTSVWSRLGVESTARNWKVTTTLAELAAAH